MGVPPYRRSNLDHPVNTRHVAYVSLGRGALVAAQCGRPKYTQFRSRVLEHLLVTEAQACLHELRRHLCEGRSAAVTRKRLGSSTSVTPAWCSGILLGRVRHVEVEDLVQEVFLRALPRVCELRDTSRFGSWLCDHRAKPRGRPLPPITNKARKAR